MLLDECVPVQPAPRLVGHDVQSVVRLRWGGLCDGAVLQRALDEGSDVVVTIDTSLEHQQVLPAGLSLIRFHVTSNHRATGLQEAAVVMDALNAIRPGQRVRLGQRLSAPET